MNMNRSMQVFAGVLVGVSLVSFSSCQRSSRYKEDQQYYREEAPSYYSKNPNEKTATQKVAQAMQPRKKVIVFDFWNSTPVKNEEIGRFAADELRRALFGSKKVIIPTDLSLTSTTEDFVQGDQVKMAQLVREGRRLGVSVVIIGRVSKVIFRQKGDDVGLFRQKKSVAAADIEMKIYDVAAGRELNAVTRSGDAQSNSMVTFEDSNVQSAEFRNEITKLAVRDAVAKSVSDVIRTVERIAWEGHIARVQGGKIYINAGKTSGILPGDIMKVISVGEDIHDPKSGAYLGRSQGQLKGTLEVVDFIGPDGAVTQIHTGGNFQEGDVVQLY